MVRKIDSVSTKATGAVESSRSVSSTEKTDAIKSIQKALSVASASGLDTSLQVSPQNKQVLLQYLDEESEKFFLSHKIPKPQQTVIKTAIRMAIEAAETQPEESTPSEEGAKNPIDK